MLSEDKKIRELKKQIRLLEQRKRNKQQREKAELGAIAQKIGIAEMLKNLTKTQITELQNLSKTAENKGFDRVARKIIGFLKQDNPNSPENKTP